MIEFPVDTVLTYQCRQGYVPTGIDSQIICRQDGLWTDLGDICKPKDCGNVPDLPNGKISYPSGVTTFGSEVLMSCNEGYRLNGRTRRICLSNGWDNGNPTCTPHDCGPFPSFTNGIIQYPNKITTVGSEVHLSCEEW
ncbi:complement decay-accelerating factor, GPI-anchored-like [Protopterus annectens]|uniref:complement decay-accelerating factor, GPI-anchored-like n=1 Tax=Protopterus annectens TaxID=7888 RepID=UPI001CF9800D|nr:complement decay-accelerating factor, GPI-anchored-like [Protopterus annectens]